MPRSSLLGLVLPAGAVAVLAVWSVRGERGTHAGQVTVTAREEPDELSSVELVEPAVAAGDSRSEDPARQVTATSSVRTALLDESAELRDATVVGRVLAPPGLVLPVDERELDDIELTWSVPSARRVYTVLAEDGSVEEVETWDGDRFYDFCDGDGSFVYTLAPVGVELELAVQSPFALGRVLSLAPLAPGERRVLTVELDAGATICGRVVDEHGRPVPELPLWIDDLALSDLTTREPERHRFEKDGETDEEGRFELRTLARHPWRVTAGDDDLLEGARTVVDATRGDRHEVELVVRRWGTIEGTVVWADGSPAESFEVRLDGHHPSTRWSGEGRFLVRGLEGGFHEIEVCARGDGVEGFASAAAVAENGAPLSLVLASSPLFELRGIVLDASGTPIPSCRISALAREPRRGSCAKSDVLGSFTLWLAPGDWDVSWDAEEFVGGGQRVIAVPGPNAPLRLVLERAGRVRGQVVDPEGNPVSEARIHGPGCEEGATDGRGHFDLPLSDTSARIWASSDGCADSETVDIEGPGNDVVLRLEPGCRLAGRVIEADGRPVEGASIDVWRCEHHGKGADTDARGEFVIKEARAGRTQLEAMDRATGRRVLREVLLAPDRPAVVELIFAPLDPVVVRGRVTSGGRPAECWVILRGPSFHVEGESGAGGRFELTVPHAGSAVAFVCPKEEDGEDRRFELEVPQRATLELDVELERLQVADEEELWW